MQIQINDKGKITGYAQTGGFENGIEVEEAPEGFAESFEPQKYIYDNGEIKEDPDYMPVDHSAPERIAELKNRLYASDYQAIKYAEGWLSEEEYAPIRAQRQAWREEINTLETK